MTTKYTFETTSYEFNDGGAGGKHHHGTTTRANTNTRQYRRSRGSSEDTDASGTTTTTTDGDPLDGTGSLTYSAASSINSATGESTDSSFADIMRVLDVQDSRELHAYLKKEALRQGKDEKSVAESLAYSTDAESHFRSLATDGAESTLQGADLISTITGRSNNHNMNIDLNLFASKREDKTADPFASSNNDDNNDLNILFSPAEHTDGIKRRKDKKRRERREQRRAALQKNNHHDTGTSTPGTSSSGTPRVKNSSAYNHNHHSNNTTGQSPSTNHHHSNYHNHNHHYHQKLRADSPRGVASSPIKIESRQGTPPTFSRPPKKKFHHQQNNRYNYDNSMGVVDDEDVWYAKWWMFCFPDTVKNMTEMKR